MYSFIHSFNKYLMSFVTWQTLRYVNIKVLDKTTMVLLSWNLQLEGSTHTAKATVASVISGNLDEIQHAKVTHRRDNSPRRSQE